MTTGLIRADPFRPSRSVFPAQVFFLSMLHAW